MFLTLTKKSPYYQLVFERNGLRSTVSTKTSDNAKAELFLKNFTPPEIKQEVLLPEVKNHDLCSFETEYLKYSESKYSKVYVDRSIKPAFKFFKEAVGNLPLNRINAKEIDSFISITQKRSLSGAALYYRTLKSAFSKAVVWNYINDNPFRKIKSPKVVKSIPEFISFEELNFILQKESDTLLGKIYLTAFYTGMRLGEILNMKWNWIDYNNNLITVKCYSGFTTKSKKDRIVPINPVLKSALQNISPVVINIDQNSFVFEKTPGIKLNEDFISKRFKQALRKTELNEHIHFHTLRHSFASNLAQKGVPLYVIKELLGHEDIQTTQIYAHLNRDNLKEAINLL